MRRRGSTSRTPEPLTLHRHTTSSWDSDGNRIFFGELWLWQCQVEQLRGCMTSRGPVTPGADRHWASVEPGRANDASAPSPSGERTTSFSMSLGGVKRTQDTEHSSFRSCQIISCGESGEGLASLCRLSLSVGGPRRNGVTPGIALLSRIPGDGGRDQPAGGPQEPAGVRPGSSLERGWRRWWGPRWGWGDGGRHGGEAGGGEAEPGAGEFCSVSALGKSRSSGTLGTDERPRY